MTASKRKSIKPQLPLCPPSADRKSRAKTASRPPSEKTTTVRSQSVFIRWVQEGKHLEVELGAPFALVLIALFEALSGGHVMLQLAGLLSKWFK
jgi:hypothetical protein